MSTDAGVGYLMVAVAALAALVVCLSVMVYALTEHVRRLAGRVDALTPEQLDKWVGLATAMDITWTGPESARVVSHYPNGAVSSVEHLRAHRFNADQICERCGQCASGGANVGDCLRG